MIISFGVLGYIIAFDAKLGYRVCVMLKCT